MPDKLTVDSFAGKIAVQWAPEDAVTPPGQLPFFIDSPKQSPCSASWCGRHG